MIQNPQMMSTETHYRQQQVRVQYIRAQRQVSFHGLRQIIGSTVIALGDRIHGVAQASCKEAAEMGAEVRSRLRSASA